MSLNVIGVGVGRTGTLSLKLALNQLGLGPCHHMDEVLQDPPTQVPLWMAAVKGHPDWEAVYAGYRSAVDWPTAGFFRELYAAYPSAKFILGVRSPESWVESFSHTIYSLLGQRDRVRPEAQPWIDMATEVILKTGFPGGLDAAGLMRAFSAHNEAVKATIPADQLLVYQVKEGWEPLCAFLGVPVPADPFPRTNDRGGFWEIVSRVMTD